MEQTKKSQMTNSQGNINALSRSLAFLPTEQAQTKVLHRLDGTPKKVALSYLRSRLSSLVTAMAWPPVSRWKGTYDLATEVVETAYDLQKNSAFIKAIQPTMQMLGGHCLDNAGTAYNLLSSLALLSAIRRLAEQTDPTTIGSEDSTDGTSSSDS